jgi:hypothetical protein
MANKRSPSVRRPVRSLYTSITGVDYGYVPKRWVKMFAAILLLIPCSVLTLAFFHAFLLTAEGGHFRSSEELKWFVIGGLVGIVWFFAFKPLQLLYVMGHELTHALWVRLHGGTVHDFEVREQGGHIVTDKTNTAIILAPYFFPFYTVCWTAAYGVAVFLLGVPDNVGLLFGGIGFTWVLHLAYTLAMILKGQPDLEYGGVFFSLMIIYPANLVFIAGLLVIASPSVTWSSFGADLLRYAMEVSALIVQVVEGMLRWGGAF